MMKKWMTMLFLMCCLFVLHHSEAMAIDVVINGEPVPFTENSGQPFIENSRTLVPLRATMEAFGATVRWDDTERCAVVAKDEVTVVSYIGEAAVYRNGTKIPNDVAAEIRGGRTYLPIRVVLESFGAEVGWNGNVTVSTDAAGALVEKLEHTVTPVENYWAEWEKAVSLQESGAWKDAIAQFHKVAYSFLSKSDSASCAIFYKRLGECYAKSNAPQMAAACFRREADYWEAAGDHQTYLDAVRRATLIRPFIGVYAKTHDAAYQSRTRFGESNELKHGILLGAYAEADQAVHDGANGTYLYMNEYPKLVGKDMGAYHLYMRSDMPFSHYASHFRLAKEKNKVMQIALEPVNFFAIGENSSNYIHLAKEMDESGLPIFLRFAGEMNDPGNPWYTSDPAVYIEKFRYVADIFHRYAPEVAVVWAPNHYPFDNAMDYYPGDEYVDYVGLSAYWDYVPERDPLGEGVDRSRYSMVLDSLYRELGYKKPFIVVESGASYMEYSTGKDVSALAAKQVKDFYTYLPMRYPNLEAVFNFDSNNGNYRYMLSENSTYLAAYRAAIQNPAYVTAINDRSYQEGYYELGNNVHMLPERTELTAFAKTVDDSIAYVIYEIDGVKVATGYEIPYRAEVDFTPYAGKTVMLTTTAFDTRGNVAAKARYRVTVDMIE